MTKSPKPRRSWVGSLFLIAGLILIVAGALTAFASSQPIGPEPVDFGEAAPPIRPTVTPLPVEGQNASPTQLPETPLELNPTIEPAVIIAAAPRPTATPDAGPQTPQRIVIPAIDLDAPVETVGWHVINGASQWDVPDHFAAGWLKTSARLGEVGNTVLDGHHNIAGEVFRYLVDLKVGDEIEMYTNGQVLVYKVTARKILRDRDQPYEVRVKNAQWIQPTDDERLTLVTCWPYTTNTHRLIIVAKPTGAGPSDVSQ